MKKIGLPIWLVVSATLAMALSLFSIAKRHRVEAHNKAVCISAEFETIEALATAQDMSVERGITDLKAQGLTAVVLSEETLGDLVGQGKVVITSTQFDAGPGRPKIPMSGLQFTDEDQLHRVQHALNIRFRGSMRKATTRGLMLSLPPVTPALLRTLAVGLNPTQVATAQKAHLAIVARCANPIGASSKTVEDTLKWIHDDGATVFLPQGDQVLGRRDALSNTIETLRSLNMLYASPEFAKIGGDQTVLEDAKDIVVRLHAAQAAELDKLPDIEAVERYGKAARERNMRILLVRPISFASKEPLGSFAEFIKKINHQILREGGDMGLPRPFEEPGIPKPFFIILGLALAPCVWWAAALFVRNRTVQIVGAVLLTFLGVACYVKTGQHVMAFLASCAFPIIAFAMLDRWRPKNVILGYLAVCVVSLAGGLAVAGMLNSLAYYVKADEFRAVKVSVFLPIAMVGALFFRSLVDWRQSLKNPITWGAAGLGLLLLAAFGLMIARTGNDSGVGASGGETFMRSLLDRILYVRPRTKEFLIGHPFLIIGIGLLAQFKKGESSSKQNGGWIAVLLMIGAMGQSDVVNTLTHLHIPVLLSLVRIVEGWVIGGIIGYVVWQILTTVTTRRKAPAENLNA